MDRSCCAAVVFLAGFALGGAAHAQDTEPNDVCPGEPLGMPVLPFSLSGSLDGPPTTPDVDVFQLDLQPGAEILVDYEGEPTGAGTLPDPLLGLYNSDCTLIAVDDDGGVGVNSRMIFTVPADGVVVLAASAFPDFDFVGAGGAPGSYTLTLREPPGVIRSIRGRLVDAGNGQGLSGGPPTFANVLLSRCEEDGCFGVAFATADPVGRFGFNGAALGLRAGLYQLSAGAVGYEEGQRRTSRRFAVAAGEAFNFGNLPLRPNPLQIIGTELCPPLPVEGGVCTYSLSLHNRSDEPFSGRVWSLVDYFLPEGDFIYAFQVGDGNVNNPAPIYVWLAPDEVERVAFDLRVPPEWAALEEGGFACASAAVGRAPFAVYNLVDAVGIGCLSRRENGVAMAPGSAPSGAFETGAQRRVPDPPGTARRVLPNPGSEKVVPER